MLCRFNTYILGVMGRRRTDCPLSLCFKLPYLLFAIIFYFYLSIINSFSTSVDYNQTYPYNKYTTALFVVLEICFFFSSHMMLSCAPCSVIAIQSRLSLLVLQLSSFRAIQQISYLWLPNSATWQVLYISFRSVENRRSF